MLLKLFCLAFGPQGGVYMWVKEGEMVTLIIQAPAGQAYVLPSSSSARQSCSFCFKIPSHPRILGITQVKFFTFQLPRKNVLCQFTPGNTQADYVDNIDRGLR